MDALRDFDMVNSELVMHDQIFVEKRIERLSAMVKKIKDEDQKKELALMEKMLAHLEQELPLRLLELSEDEEKLIRSYPFITLKKLVVAVNVAEDDLGNTGILDAFKDSCNALAIEAMLVSAKVEAEIAMLRITSYNVCYTKLLRVNAGSKSIFPTNVMFLFSAMASMARA